MCIKFLREHLMREVHKKLGQDGIKPCDINWVLTVPAIWSDAAKWIKLRLLTGLTVSGSTNM
jgi:hypothetical protein